MARVGLIAVVPFVLLLTVTLAGVDFGRYWDDEAMFTKVRRALAPPPTLLPYAYDYPSMTFWISLAAVAPEAVQDPRLRHGIPDTSGLDAFTRSDAYRHRMRVIFAVMSSLTVVWVVALSRAAGATAWESFAAALFMAASWEVGYHLRWIAPDGVTMQFVAAAVACALASLKSRARAGARWLMASAAAAGLATASKYSAWPAVIPAAMAAMFVAAPSGVSGRTIEAVRVILIAIATFFIVSPGTLLQPTLAFSQIRAQILHYGGGHGIYTVGRGADHLWRMLAYDTLVQPSPYPVLAAVMTIAAIAGAYALCRESWPTAAVLLAFPVFYSGYFALQKVMVVRNLLVVAPFGAVLAARGFRKAWEAAGATRACVAARAAIAVGATAIIAANVSFEVAAVGSIRRRSAERTLGEFTAWVQRQPAGSVVLSDRLRHAVTPSADDVATSPEPYVAMYALDPGHERVRPNQPFVFERVFGPREVNLNYYPDWIGDEHIVVLSWRQARRFGVAGS